MDTLPGNRGVGVATRDGFPIDQVKFSLTQNLSHFCYTSSQISNQCQDPLKLKNYESRLNLLSLGSHSFALPIVYWCLFEKLLNLATHSPYILSNYPSCIIGSHLSLSLWPLNSTQGLTLLVSINMLNTSRTYVPTSIGQGIY